MCKDELGPEILKMWREVKEICDNHDYPSLLEGQQLLPDVDQDYLRETLEKNLQFNPDYYRITNLMYPGQGEPLEKSKEASQQA